MEKKNVTEVFITHVKKEKYDLYMDWVLKIQKIESSFLGYKSIYLESPSLHNNGAWITVVSFDSEENLDNWLNSDRRLEILKESENFVEHYENHRLKNPFSVWFPTSLAVKKSKFRILKEAMLVLLVLFPIVMLSFKFLTPLLKELNLSLATFISNVLSVGLLTWPMMPLVLYCFNSWFDENQSYSRNILGYALVIALYIIFIAIFYV